MDMLHETWYRSARLFSCPVEGSVAQLTSCVSFEYGQGHKNKLP